MGDKITVLTTGGTIDKIYFDASSQFEVGETIVEHMLHQAAVQLPFEVIEVMRKDSLDLTDADRDQIRTAAASVAGEKLVVTHGTDTMTDTAAVLRSLPGKTIVLTGALAPARFAETDAMFNLGMAFAAVQALPHGVYIVMNGTLFDSEHVRKDRSLNAFVYK